MRCEPEFQCILKFSFDNDIDVEALKREMSCFNSIRAVPLSKSGYARLNNEKLPGSLWVYYPSEKEYEKSWEIQTFLCGFFEKIPEDGLKKLKDLTEKFNGKVVVAINIFFCNDNLPELCLYGKVMQVIHYLNADLCININQENGTEN